MILQILKLTLIVDNKDYYSEIKEIGRLSMWILIRSKRKI